MPVRRPSKGFTLVELLVVIGIIALLISILLPALSKAREQANMVVCQSNERQFYAVWTMYATEYKGSVLPSVAQIPSHEDDFNSAALIGNELGKKNINQSSDEASIIKVVFTCPSASHVGDPDADNTAALGLPSGSSGYWGDYVYNDYMGVLKNNNATPPVPSYPYYWNLKTNQVPGNVIILMESWKPNFLSPPGNYKPYFSTSSGISGIFTTDPTNISKPANKLAFNEIGTPHNKRTKMNVLSADGHISLVDPYKDFFTDPKLQSTVRDYLWDAKEKAGGDPTQGGLPPSNSQPGWQRGLPGL